jgi:hypothetical protein
VLNPNTGWITGGNSADVAAVARAAGFGVGNATSVAPVEIYDEISCWGSA